MDDWMGTGNLEDIGWLKGAVKISGSYSINILISVL